ncbi:MAG: cation-translocating P-type ATPase [Treponema sp.]|jgi:heavy metal translocating P-type ATPase|nr:cation-translocating P-type ATPase [Treponema sp.]
MSCAKCNNKQEKEKNENILKKTYNFLSSLIMTLIGGLFLAASLALFFTNYFVPVDPAWAAVVICGYALLYNAIWSVLFNKGILKITSSLLISIAMIAAIYIGEFFAAGQVAFIMAIGGVLEEKTIKRAKKGIKKLIALTPRQGRIIKNSKEELIPIKQIKKDDVLRILPGEAVPVDGEIMSGDTSVDQSIITGESLPIDKTAGDSVFCGTINCFGSIDIKATKVGEDSSLQKLIRLVQEAENNKAPLQRIVDKWAVWLVPIALSIAIGTYIVTGDIYRAVTIAIVFCPCALALATPTSVMAAIGQAAKYGVIIKSGEALEKMGKVDTIAFDKTGTLTYGNLVVSDIISFDSGLSETGLLSLVASAESHSEHPLGKAIVNHAKKEGIDILPIEQFKMIPGKGLSARVNDMFVLCGSSSWLEENGVSCERVYNSLEKLRAQGKATVLVARGGECIGLAALSDTLRENAKSMVQELKRANSNTVLLTGDNKQTADYFAHHLGIKSVYAELLPAQKVEKIQGLQKEGKNICMIGDGVNDAPALKTANVGVAMGTMGSDIAVEAADIALMGDDIAKIPYLKRLSNATIKLIYFNVSISIVFNIAAITLSILGFLNPVTGALAHNAGSIAVVLNAALLYDRKY